MMVFWTSVLIVLVTTVLVMLYRLGALRQRRVNEPPLDKGLIPWLGHAMDMSRDASSFLKRMQERHGDIFTVQMAGRYVTFVTDPFSFDAVLKESRSRLDSSKLVFHLVFKAFDFQGQKCHGNIMQKSAPKYLMGTGLVGLTQAIMDNLQILMLEPDADKRPGPQQWKQEGLFQYCCNIVFRASYLALFGNLPINGKTGHAEDRLQSQKVFERFREFNSLFPSIIFSMLLPMEKKEMRRLRQFFWDILSPQHILERDDVSAWIRSAQEQQVEEGVSEKAQSQFNLLMLWVSSSNPGATSFWTLLFLLKNPEALKAVREEAEGVLRKMGQGMRPGGAPITVEYSMLQQTPVLDSVMEETLRLVLTNFLLRTVKQDMILKMDGGKEYALRQGDEVSIFPFLFLHRDPEIYPDPTTFKYDRFLNPDGSRKVVFYKQGRKVKPHMLPWGAGTTVCPGRFFALNEMKMFVFMMVTQYDIELVDQDVKIPSVKGKLFGISAMQPIQDVQFQYRIRF